MSTRLKRPAFWRHLMITAGLAAFQGYLGYSFFTGQFGFESQDVLEAEIDELGAKSAALQAEIDSYRHRISLFKSSNLDPDLVSERARALLSMAQPGDIVVMVDPRTGKPVSGSGASSTTDQLTGIIEAGID
ncbi:MAG: septum formation initiator family protein [Devosia sp.]|nr:septum formation initiator family protein [Devosia sp.]